MTEPKRMKKPSNENRIVMALLGVLLVMIGLAMLGCEPVPATLTSTPTTMPVLNPGDPRTVALAKRQEVYSALRRYMHQSEQLATDYMSWTGASITADVLLQQAHRRHDEAKIQEWTDAKHKLKQVGGELDEVAFRLRTDLTALRMNMALWEIQNPGLWLYPFAAGAK